MTTATLPVPSTPALPRQPAYTPHSFSKAEFFHMVEQGWFIDKRVEFIEGNVIDMWPVSSDHCFCISLVQIALQAAFGANVWIRPQMPLDVSPRSFVLPDLIVLPGPLQSHRGKGTPTTADVVVEVSESSLSYDRNYKASLYAVSGISDYWIVNLPDRQLEIRRTVQADPASPYGVAYADLTILRAGDVAVPLAAPNARIAVADLLP